MTTKVATYNQIAKVPTWYFSPASRQRSLWFLL
jgi:hypothetical protein